MPSPHRIGLIVRSSNVTVEIEIPASVLRALDLEPVAPGGGTLLDPLRS